MTTCIQGRDVIARVCIRESQSKPGKSLKKKPCSPAGPAGRLAPYPVFQFSGVHRFESRNQQSKIEGFPTQRKPQVHLRWALVIK